MVQRALVNETQKLGKQFEFAGIFKAQKKEVRFGSRRLVRKQLPCQQLIADEFLRPHRASLQTNHLPTIAVFTVIGPSLSKFHPVEYVGMWLWNGRRFAEGTDRREREEMDAVSIAYSSLCDTTSSMRYQDGSRSL
jgi:hypothetical protein